MFNLVGIHVKSCSAHRQRSFYHVESCFSHVKSCPWPVYGLTDIKSLVSTCRPPMWPTSMHIVCRPCRGLSAPISASQPPQ